MLKTVANEGKINEVHGDKENIKLLNDFLGDIELSKREEATLVWLSSWETYVIKDLISVMKKVESRVK